MIGYHQKKSIKDVIPQLPEIDDGLATNNIFLATADLG